MKNLIQFCKAISKKNGLQFSLRSKKIEDEEVFSDVGLLPALLKRADQLSSLCFGVTSSATYVDEEKSILGTKLLLKDNASLPMGVYLSLLDTIEEITRGVRNGRVDLDELLYD